MIELEIEWKQFSMDLLVFLKPYQPRRDNLIESSPISEHLLFQTIRKTNRKIDFAKETQDSQKR